MHKELGQATRGGAITKMRDCCSCSWGTHTEAIWWLCWLPVVWETNIYIFNFESTGKKAKQVVCIFQFFGWLPTGPNNIAHTPHVAMQLQIILFLCVVPCRTLLISFGLSNQLKCTPQAIIYIKAREWNFEVHSGSILLAFVGRFIDV